MDGPSACGDTGRARASNGVGPVAACEASGWWVDVAYRAPLGTGGHVMGTIRAKLAEATPEGETISRIRIGAYGYGYAKLDPTGEFDYNDPAIEEFLDQERDFGYGTVGHNPLWAWTERYVIVTEVYDGSTGFMAVPLAPDTPGEPDFIGGH